MIDAIAVIQEALIDLYLNVKVRSKDEITKYDEEDLVQERENLYMTSPIDLINYIQIFDSIKNFLFCVKQKGRHSLEHVNIPLLRCF
jgi:hypothetical protein